ncbi:hypothetical protein M2650_03480 [Luteimonas sp. SX5]|uniref:DUF1418 family protein n=1 Tax=Luteimonas galliterrae TaxID=2940486 RepID=A0ABT0MFP9_9GAMM|nr:hypothetical protein [Luteimonas galliterrae]
MKSRREIRWLRIAGILLLFALVAFGCRFILDEVTAAFPEYSVAVNVVLMILFAVLLAFLVMPLLVKELGFQIVGKQTHPPQKESPADGHDDRGNQG